MISLAPIDVGTSSVAAQSCSISALYAVPGAPLAMELQNTIQAGGTARNIGQRNKRNPMMNAASMTPISEYLGEEPEVSLIFRRIWPDPPHRQPRLQNHPAARLPPAVPPAGPAWPTKPRTKPSEGRSRSSGAARAIVALQISEGNRLRASAAKRGGSSQMAWRGGAALGVRIWRSSARVRADEWPNSIGKS